MATNNGQTINDKFPEKEGPGKEGGFMDATSEAIDYALYEDTNKVFDAYFRRNKIMLLGESQEKGLMTVMIKYHCCPNKVGIMIMEVTEKLLYRNHGCNILAVQ